MYRVTSRQRLVSWDSFDAATGIFHDDEHAGGAAPPPPPTVTSGGGALSPCSGGRRCSSQSQSAAVVVPVFDDNESDYQTALEDGGISGHPSMIDFRSSQSFGCLSQFDSYDLEEEDQDREDNHQHYNHGFAGLWVEEEEEDGDVHGEEVDDDGATATKKVNTVLPSLSGSHRKKRDRSSIVEEEEKEGGDREEDVHHDGPPATRQAVSFSFLASSVVADLPPTTSLQHANGEEEVPATILAEKKPAGKQQGHWGAAANPGGVEHGGSHLSPTSISANRQSESKPIKNKLTFPHPSRSLFRLYSSSSRDSFFANGTASPPDTRAALPVGVVEDRDDPGNKDARLLRSAVVPPQRSLLRYGPAPLAHRCDCSFDDVVEDAKFVIFAYLTAEELRTVSVTSKTNLFLSRDLSVWTEVCSRRWTVLRDHLSVPPPGEEGDLVASPSAVVAPMRRRRQIVFHEESCIPTSPLPSTLLSNSKTAPPPNLSVLHGMTQPHPSSIDPKFFQPKPPRYHTRGRAAAAAAALAEADRVASTTTHRRLQRPAVAVAATNNNNSSSSSIASADFRKFYMRDSSIAAEDGRRAGRRGVGGNDGCNNSCEALIPVFQFTKRVGRGDRCVRSDVAFPTAAYSRSPRPTPSSSSSHPASFSSRWGDVGGSGGTGLSALYDLLCHNGVTTLKPFVSPFVMPERGNVEGGGAAEVVSLNVTPRLFAYFEISILARDPSQEPSSLEGSGGGRHQHGAGDNGGQPPADCVAIGLSADNFSVSEKMPGWDAASYGYHGDDGGIFHSNGDMIRRFGPTFGVGDTVGCGIDYASRGIFFTLNGQFLGYAWTDVDLSKRLYPTIGVDSHCPITWNFGARPWVFDVSPFAEQHADLIETAFDGFPLASLSSSSLPSPRSSSLGATSQGTKAWSQRWLV